MGCIYGHRCKITDKWYIGQTKYQEKSINDRWQDGKAYGEKTRIGLAIKKYGWGNFEHVILESNVAIEDLDQREIYWIAYYDSYASGYNCTLGGKNISDCFSYKVKVYCYQTKEFFSSIIEASQKTNFSYSKIQRQLLTKHRLETDELYFCVVGEEKTPMPKFYKVPYVLHGNKNIICVEENKIYNSIMDCAREKNIKPQNLGKACKSHNSLKGLHFAFLEEYDDEWKPSREYNASRRKEVSSLKKEIFCFQTQRFYSSATDAAEELNIPVRAVSRCAKKDGDLIQTHGYNFCYKEDWFDGWVPRENKQGTHLCSEESKIKMRNNNSKSKKVICLETRDIFISASEAGRALGISKDTIIRVCNNKSHHKTAGGYHWKYVD